MRKRDLARQLAAEAKRAMPPAEARKFAAVLRSGKTRSLPRDGLPPLTADTAPPQPVSRTECGWYYGGPCGCARPHGRFQAKSKPQQLGLPL